MAFEDYSATPGSNTVIAGRSIAPGGPPSTVGPAVRQLMADGKMLSDSVGTIETQVSRLGPTTQFYPGARSFVPQGANGVGAITGGSGGTNGTFSLAFTGGNFNTNPAGTFTVVGGAVTSITLTGPGLYIGGAISAPTLSFAASGGLTGASAALTTGYLVGAGQYYLTDHASDPEKVARFQNQANAAVEVEASVDYLDIGVVRGYSEDAQDAATAAAASAAETAALSPFPPGHDVDLDRLEAPFLYGPGVRTDVSYRINQFDNNVIGRFYLSVQQTDFGTDNNPVIVALLSEPPRTGKTPLIVPPFGDSGVYLGAASVDCGSLDAFQASNGLISTAGINPRTQLDTLGWKDAVRQTVGLGANTTPSRQIGTVIHTGMTEYVFDNSASDGGTFRTIFTLPAPVSRMRVIFALSNSGGITLGRAAIAPVATLAGVSSIPNGDWTALTFSGAEGSIIPTRPNNNRRSYIASDWANVASIARTDDSTKLPLVAVAAYMPDEVNIRMLGNAPNDIDRTVWATHPDRPWISRYDTGDCVTTPANFADTTNISNTPIIGIQYELVSGEVLTIGAIGDSITECIATGTTYPGASWAFETALDMQSPFLAVDCANIGWSGASASAIGYQWIDYLAFCQAYDLTVPSVVFCPNASPNSFSTPITDAEVGSQFVLLRDAMKQIKSAGSLPIGWTIIPTNPANKDYGSSDIKRRDYNDEWRDNYAGAGITVADMDEVMAGVLDGDGQMQIGVGLTSDNIHPNDAGIQAMASVALPAVRSVADKIDFDLGTLVTA